MITKRADEVQVGDIVTAHRMTTDEQEEFCTWEVQSISQMGKTIIMGFVNEKCPIAFDPEFEFSVTSDYQKAMRRLKAAFERKQIERRE